MNNIEERVEKSIFELIRKQCVLYGYTPDIMNAARYPSSNDGIYTIVAQNNWNADLLSIKSTKGFAIEIFGSAASFARGLKKVPRIAINPKRIMPGDIGAAPGFDYTPSGINSTLLRRSLPDSSSDLHIDIHLISASIAQSRLLNQIIQETLGHIRYITFFDSVKEYFLMVQYNYFDVSDANDGVFENVYSYEAKDLYLFDDENPITISPITDIDADILLGDKDESEDTNNPIHLTQP